MRPPPRFPRRPNYPPGYMLPEDWQDWTGGPFPSGHAVIWSGAHEVRKLQAVFSRVAPAGVATDPAVITMHFLNLTDDEPDSTWVDADFLAVEDAFDDFWTATKIYYTTGTSLDQLRWYKDGPAYHPTPSEGNPAVRIIERSVAGTGTGVPCPPQVAVSLTEKTALRRRWGRIYMPAPDAALLTTGGLLGTVYTAGFCDALEDMYEACIAADIVPVVFSPTVETSYQIESVQVDNLLDVIRSRRWKSPTVREQRDLTD